MKKSTMELTTHVIRGAEITPRMFGAFLALAALKLVGVDMSWGWVTMPIWGAPAFALGQLVLIGTISLLDTVGNAVILAVLGMWRRL